ncbi:hypothetical protein [Clostridium amazonitimonense]|uniref:hypothetical protein n=1 Tax=Clostridium amazonitimonense TaxID=1499689 RepID=UPI0005094420|nr:hypothetical protein [Clostridium amazonitimonense]
MNNINRDISIYIDGLGIALYSPGMVTDIAVGNNFLMQEFNRPADIGEHIRKGDITAFCTGTPGQFELRFRSGYPDKIIDKEYPVAIRLGLQVKGGKIHVIDLYWLMEFTPECPQEQVVEVQDGFYHITALTRKPNSGIWGEDQTIYIYLNELPEMPELAWNGAPPLFVE